jgi:hypothetical protein
MTDHEVYMSKILTLHSDAVYAMGEEIRTHRKTNQEILNYCKPYRGTMWADYVSSLILKCDFREIPSDN